MGRFHHHGADVLASGLDCTPCSAEYTYDANGNMVTRPWQGGTQTLSYDAENRLVGVSGPVTATLGYDGQGNRVLRQTPGARGAGRRSMPRLRTSVPTMNGR